MLLKLCIKRLSYHYSKCLISRKSAPTWAEWDGCVSQANPRWLLGCVHQAETDLTLPGLEPELLEALQAYSAVHTLELGNRCSPHELLFPDDVDTASFRVTVRILCTRP